MNNTEIKQLPVNDNLYDMLLLDSVESVRHREDFSVYSYNDIPVPRVTKILDSCINKDFLIIWAAKLGYYKYLNEKDFATSIGSKVHEMIEHFLHTGEDLDISYKKAPKQAPIIDTAYNNFKNWFYYLQSLNCKFELIDTEISLSCPYYGGTLDCLCKINNAVYILDFKTSKKISYDYIMQVIAYKWMVDNGYLDPKYNINHIDGVGIIRVDKEQNKFEDLFLNEFDQYGKSMIDVYTKGFGSVLSSYYSKINMEYTFSNYKKHYVGIESIIE